jgi:hypothetical protein
MDAMEISPQDARPAIEGPAANFTGKVSITPLFGPNEARAISGAEVAFSPCPAPHGTHTPRDRR